MRDNKLYLKDILEAMSSIERFVMGVDFEDFKKNDEKSSAVIKKFEIIGEATKNIPENIRQQSPDVPWKEMAMFRDKLVHFYFGVKYEIVWATIKDVSPQLKPEIRKILNDLENGK